MISNSRGSITLWVLGIAAVIAIFASALPNYYKQMDRQYKVSSYRIGAVSLKESILSMLDNDAVWIQVINKNSNMACLRTAGQTCTAANFGPINLFEGDGTAFGSLATNSGFDVNGKPCVGFDPVNGHETCVYKIVVSWSCAGVNCATTKIPPGYLIAVEPSIQLRATFKFSPLRPDLKGTLNETSTAYTMDFIRGSANKTLSKFCNSLDGMYNQQSLECATTKIGTPDTFNCRDIAGPQSWFAGFDSAGNPQCIPDVKVNVTCPPGTAVLGYQADGSLSCGTF